MTWTVNRTEWARERAMRRVALSDEEWRSLRRSGDLRRWSDPGLVAREQARRVASGALKPGVAPVGDVLTVGGRDYPLPPMGQPLFVRGKGLIAAAIAWGTRSAFNHVAMYVGRVRIDRVVVPAVLEARPSGALLTPLTDYITGRDVRRALWGDVPEFREAAQRHVAFAGSNPHVSATIDAEETRIRLASADIAMGTVGTPYGWPGVVAIGAAQFGIRFGMVDRRIRALDNAFCSQLYAWSLSSAGVHLKGVGNANDSRHTAPDIWAVSPGDLARGRTLYPMTAATPDWSL